MDTDTRLTQLALNAREREKQKNTQLTEKNTGVGLFGTTRNIAQENKAYHSLLN